MRNTLLLLLMLLSIPARTQVIITTIAGIGTPGYSGDGGPATAAQLKYPDGIVLDNAGNLYIGEHLGTIRKVDVSGIITTVCGSGVVGYSGDGGAATNAKISTANFLALDKKGNLYFSDLGNRRVRKIDNAGMINTIAGNGASTVSGMGGPATAAGLGPTVGGVYVDDTGSLFIGVSYRVLKVDTFGIISVFAGTGGMGYSGDGGPATAAEVAGSSQIAMDKYGSLYITERNVRKISPGGIISNVAGNSSMGIDFGDGGPATNAQFNYTVGVAIDKCDNVFISDYPNNRIRMVNSANIIGAISGTGVAGYTGDGGPPGYAQLKNPVSICFDKSGNLYISDHMNNVIRKITYPTCWDNLTTDLIVSEKVTVYPNPANDELFIQTPTSLYSMAIVTNTVGQQVFQYALKTYETKLDIRGLSSGVYILSLKGEQGSYRQQFVKY